RLGQITLLTEAERQLVLVDWNETSVQFPCDTCIHELFEAQVERAPEADAIIFEQQRLSYRELNARANQLAHYLRSIGVGPEWLVGVCLDRSAEMIVAVLGILKAGGAYVPLDPDYPTARLQFMLDDSQIPILLTNSTLVGRFPVRP